MAAVVVRSTWDYHLRPSEFLGWVSRLESHRTTLFNPPATLRWNHDKRYLRELEEAGVHIVPTAWILPGDPRTLRTVLADRGWARAVVKPAISASAYETFVVNGDTVDAEEVAWRRVLARGTVLVQPFLGEVAEDGEWSLCFFAGGFSHAVRKRPREGEFRSQAEFGGELVVAHPPEAAVDAAYALLETAGQEWLYARVDGVLIRDEFALMELEFIEPMLFLELVSDAPTRFAQAITARIGE
jgi:glutathione synthase/RimK-type ligase-like ATP-grasp enzyme